MPDYFAQKASDLAREDRLIVERWLGRALSNDETISLNAYRPHIAPVGDEREALRRDVVAQATEIGSRAQSLSEEGVDALVDGAFAAIRGRHS